MTRRAVLWGGIAAATVVAAVVAVVWFSSGASVDEPERGSAGGSVPILSANFGGSGPGSLVRAMTMPGLHDVLERRMLAARVVYRSTSGDGQPTVVSGSVFIPAGDPPDGGWPVIAYGHGTTGIDKSCAPSSSDSLLGYAEAVGVLVRRGYAVALADYQGIGTPGVHPYTDSRTAGLNMIDAVRALRATFRYVSNRWGAFGGSQGGGAAWAADEQARTYAPELKLVGAVTVSPTADLTGLADRAERGTLTTEQEILLSGIVKSLTQLHPDVKRDDYRRDEGARDSDVDSPCTAPVAPAAAPTTTSPTKIASDDIAPRSLAAADRLRKYLSEWALPQQRLSAPLYVWYGGTDPFIDPSWTADAVRRVCALGGTVAVVFERDKGHGEINYNDQFNWLTDRFADRPVTNACA
jgi:alpha-beta hydrolase superfamily lysophospholipase